MAAFTTLALIGLAGLATAKTIEAKKKDNALKAAPSPTMLGGSTAVPRGSTALSGGPTPPDASLASSQAAMAALGAASKQRKKAGSSDSRIGKPGSLTPPARLQTKTLLGY